MTPTAQHTALMEALGWKRVKTTGFIMEGWNHPAKPRFVSEGQLPPLSLDLIAEAEKTLTKAQLDQYDSRLHYTGARTTKERKLEVFLRVTGRWIES